MCPQSARENKSGNHPLPICSSWRFTLPPLPFFYGKQESHYFLLVAAQLLLAAVVTMTDLELQYLPATFSDGDRKRLFISQEKRHRMIPQQWLSSPHFHSLSGGVVMTGQRNWQSWLFLPLKSLSRQSFELLFSYGKERKSICERRVCATIRQFSQTGQTFSCVWVNWRNLILHGHRSNLPKGKCKTRMKKFNLLQRKKSKVMGDVRYYVMQCVSLGRNAFPKNRYYRWYQWYYTLPCFLNQCIVFLL